MPPGNVSRPSDKGKGKRFPQNPRYKKLKKPWFFLQPPWQTLTKEEIWHMRREIAECRARMVWPWILGMHGLVHKPRKFDNLVSTRVPYMSE